MKSYNNARQCLGELWCYFYFVFFEVDDVVQWRDINGNFQATKKPTATFSDPANSFLGSQE